MNAPSAAVADATRRQRRAAAPDATAWVGASAGTGKTKVLADRVLSLLLDGAAPERLLCLTYTRAAAAEMANRINLRLARWSVAEDDELNESLAELSGAEPDEKRMTLARALFARVLDTPGGLKIMTLHAFCQSLIARFPLEADIAPHFEVMDDRSAAEALRDACAAVLAAPDASLARAVAVVSGWVNEDQFAEVLKQLARDRGRFARLLESAGGADGLVRRQRDVLGVGADETAATVIAAACDDAAFDGAALRRAAAALAKGTKTDRARGDKIATWLADPVNRAASFEDYCRAYLKKELDAIFETLANKDVASAEPWVPDALRTEAERVLAVLERRKAVRVAEASAALVRFGAALIAEYAAHKRAHAVLDYEDLVLAARKLLERSGGAAWVLYKLDGGIEHVLIDEAQDTSPDQWAVVEALAAEFYAGEGAHALPRTVFAVGDPKQSIFSFQGADPDSFERMRTHFRTSARDAGGRWEEVELDVSFRSADAVLLTVDAVFAQDAAKDGVVAPGQALRHRAAREGQAGLVELWPPVRPDEKDEDAPWTPPLEYRHEKTPEVRLARAIARRIKGWIAGGEILASKDRPIRAGDIMVLVSRRTAFVDALVRSLKALSVPVAGVDRMVLSDQAAIEDLTALGRFLLLPEDDLTLAAVLKGPLYGFDDDALFALAHGRAGTLWAELQRRGDERPEFARAYAELAELLGRTDYVAPYELYAELLGARGGRNRILARLGRDARDPIDEFLVLALAFESAHPPSLQGFLQWLETGAVEVKRDLEHGLRDEVRILTVHGAKGLQAPIVFLPDTFHTPRATDPILWLGDSALLWPPRREAEDSVSRAARAEANAARDRERRRLLYVAMTRAEDRLYVCGWQTRNKPDARCWYRLIESAMPGLAAPCAFDFTAELGVDGWTGPGWRLATAQRAAPETAADDRASLPDPERDLPDWTRRVPPAELPPRPLQPSRPDEEEPAVRPPAGEGAAAFRRGTLVHRLLQLLPEIDPERRRDAALRFLALPSHRLDPAAREDIVAEVLRVLTDPRFAAVFQPGARAEVALAGEVAGRIVSGQVDRLHVGANAVLVVDYKSNRSPPEAAEHTPRLYLRQLAAYRSVLGQIYPGKSIHCALLWTAVPRLVAIPEELLAASRVD